MNRCPWAGTTDALMLRYHDEEWGVPSHDPQHVFEMLTLEGAQAGLSWTTILRKREGYRAAFAGFDIDAVARLGPDDVARLMSDTGIVRNGAKIAATIDNARAAIALREAETTLAGHLWTFVPDGRPIQNRWHQQGDAPAETAESRAMSRDLKKRGFRFVGPTICYAFMQAAGLVNDHTTDCFRWPEVGSEIAVERDPADGHVG